MPHSGACLCGAVKVEIKSTQEAQALCHCLDCQVSSGSNYSTNVVVKEDDVKWTGPVKEYVSKAASGNDGTFGALSLGFELEADPETEVHRGFCSECGTSLYHNSVAFGDSTAVQTGTLPDFRKIPIAVELFTKDRWTAVPAISGVGQFETMPPA